jgi:hypothetical protein
MKNAQLLQTHLSMVSLHIKYLKNLVSNLDAFRFSFPQCRQKALVHGFGDNNEHAERNYLV